MKNYVRKIQVKGLHVCEKCGNVMVIKVLKRNSNPKGQEIHSILQCVVCKHWVEI